MVFVKEYKSRYYGVLPYYLAKSLIEIPFSLIFPVVFACIVYYISGFNSETVWHLARFGKRLHLLQSNSSNYFS